MTARADTAHTAWDRRWQTEEGRKNWSAAEPEVLDWIAEARKRGGMRALDLGSGVGRHTLAIAAAGFDTHALDGSVAGIEHLRKLAAASGLSVEFTGGPDDASPVARRFFRLPAGLQRHLSR